MQSGARGLTLLMLFSLLGFALVGALLWAPETKESPYSQLVQDVSAGRIEAVTLSGDMATAQAQDGEIYRVRIPKKNGALESLLQANAVKVTYDPLAGSGGDGSLLVWLIPLLMLGSAVWLMGGGDSAGEAFHFTETRVRTATPEERQIGMQDVAGMPEAKAEVAEVVDFLRSPERYVALGARIPKGVLLWGPPGTGKTLLARAVAGESGASFFSMAGSDFVELFAGVGAGRVRDLFAKARAATPCIIFIDELDAVGRRRGVSAGSGSEEREQTLNQLLVEMDGFTATEGIIVMAATNRLDILDPALLRPGRFDRQICVDLPDCQGRLEILQVHAQGKRLAADASLDRMAGMTGGFSGADLANLLNEAALLTVRRRKQAIGMAEMLEAYERLLGGGPALRRSLAAPERWRVAVHEAGHAVLSCHLPHADRVHKVSVVARGRSLGQVLYRPQEEKHMATRSELMERLIVLLGGRAAEERLMGEVGTGSADDLERVTELARQMVMELGMSPEIGPVAIQTERSVVYGLAEVGITADRTACAVDEAVRRLVTEGYRQAQALVAAHEGTLRRLSNALMEVESVEGPVLERLLDDGDEATLVDSDRDAIL
ncbi:MAG: ATP-dependent zinc metalloprotease FtsH [Mycobacterium leprae]